jgi:uncharacterized protein YbjT (DUF2867 family)
MAGAEVFVNTYWVRFGRGAQTFEKAIDASRSLIEAAQAAGVRRIVHVSVSNASAESRLGYYRSKAAVEQIVRSASVSHAIVRPTLIVGSADVLTSNIAWFLRRFPVFPVPDGGRYRIQPVTLDDVARIIADAAEASTNCEVDAAGPEIFTFRRYVEAIAAACRCTARVVDVPGWLALDALRSLEVLLHDVVLTRDELDGLEQEMLVSRAAPLGTESVLAWLEAHGAEVGRRYTNDVERHFGAGRTEPISGA